MGFFNRQSGGGGGGHEGPKDDHEIWHRYQA